MIIRKSNNRVKDAIFNILRKFILGNKFNKVKFLDLYCGSSGVGSRAILGGIIKVCFIDKKIRNLEDISIEMKSLKKIKYNIIKNNINGNTGTHKTKFHCIFMDPPYKSNINCILIKKISYYLNVKFIFFIETYNKISYKVILGYNIIKIYKYSNGFIFILKNNIRGNEN